MSSSPNNNSASSADGAANANGEDKPRLTEEEKKQNHIASGKCRQLLALLDFRYSRSRSIFTIKAIYAAAEK